MLKKMISIILVGLLFIPMLSLADTKEYVTQNLEEALTQEGIEHDLGNYEESDSKINIYLFRGNECPFCNKFLTFLYNNIEEYGKYFNLVSYEVYNNADNSKLLDEVSTFMDGKATNSIPYAVIGDEVFVGFDEQSDGPKIKKAIKELYESKDRYDVFKAMEESEKQTSKDPTTTIIMWNAIFMVLTVGIILFVSCRQNKLLNIKIETLEKSLHKKK